MSAAGWGRATRTGMVWSTASLLTGKLSTLLATVVLARLLAPSDFGVVAAITVFLILIELGSDLGMKATVIYEQESGFSDRVQTAFTVNLVVAALLTALAVALAPLVAGFFGVEGETDLFRLAALGLLLSGLGNIQDSLLLRELAFRRRIVPELIRSIVRGVVSIALVLAGLGAEALVIGMLAGTASWTAAQWALTRFLPRFSLDPRIARSMFSYGTGAAALEVISVVSTRFDAVVIGRVLGPASLGLYTIAFRVPELAIDSVSWNLSKVAFPALARMRAQEREGLGGATLKLIRYQALFGVPLGAGLAVLAPPLVVVLFSSQWREAGGVMSALAAMSAIHAAVFPLGDVLKAVGRQRLLALLQVVELPLLVAAIVMAAPVGIVAVAWARAGMMGLHACLMLAAGARVLDISPQQVLGAARPAVAAALGVVLAGGGVRLLMPELALLPLATGAVAALAGGALTLRLLAPGTLEDLARQAMRMRPARAVSP